MRRAVVACQGLQEYHCVRSIHRNPTPSLVSMSTDDDQTSKRRREFATNFGAHHTIDPSEVDVVQKVKDLTNGQGVDVCFDAAGVQIAVDGGLAAVKARGTFVNIALWGSKRVSLDMNVMLFGERRYMAGKSRVSRAAVSALTGVFKLSHTSMAILRKLSRPYTAEN